MSLDAVSYLPKLGRIYKVPRVYNLAMLHMSFHYIFFKYIYTFYAHYLPRYLGSPPLESSKVQS